MEKALANYLFHNETLYAFKEGYNAGGELLEAGAGKSEVGSRKLPVGILKTEDSGPKREGRKPETDINVNPKVDHSEDSNKHHPITNPPGAQPTVYSMKTRYLVVVKDMQSAERELLEKIMAAIKLQMRVVDLLDVREYPNIDFKETIYGNAPTAILFFGPESGEEFLVRLKLEKYTPRVLKGINFLMADNLSTILKNENNEKKKLWECLKAVFGV